MLEAMEAARMEGMALHPLEAMGLHQDIHHQVDPHHLEEEDPQEDPQEEDHLEEEVEQEGLVLQEGSHPLEQPWL